jgi:hypothetical protein
MLGVPSIWAVGLGGLVAVMLGCYLPAPDFQKFTRYRITYSLSVLWLAFGRFLKTSVYSSRHADSPICYYCLMCTKDGPFSYGTKRPLVLFFKVRTPCSLVNSPAPICRFNKGASRFVVITEDVSVIGPGTCTTTHSITNILTMTWILDPLPISNLGPVYFYGVRMLKQVLPLEGLVRCV